MPAPTTTNGPWQDLELQAYHAYREWPLWLVLRERELAERGRPARTEQSAAGPAPAGTSSQHAAADPPGKAAPE